MRRSVIFASLVVILLWGLTSCDNPIVQSRLTDEANYVLTQLQAGNEELSSDSQYLSCKDSAALRDTIISYINTTDDAVKLAQLGTMLTKIEHFDSNIQAVLAQKIQNSLHSTEDDLEQYLSALAEVSRAEDAYYYTLDDIVSKDELTALIASCCEKTVYTNHNGGYYDQKQQKSEQYRRSALHHSKRPFLCRRFSCASIFKESLPP